MKALSLLSGGLDSILATKLIIDQGVSVEAVYFHNPFCDCSSPNSSCKVSRQVAGLLNIPFHNIELKQEYLDMIRNPRHGYGKNINPCIDCRIMEFKMAKKMLKEHGASFIVTGEVVNERPMSQRKYIMEMIDKEAGVEDIVLRPLSAKILKQTLPEKEGIVDREKLFDINGRSRKIQMELAKRFGIKEYPTPSGGCQLTYVGFSDKVRDLIKYNQLNMEEVRLLNLGRHFRFGGKTKFIVGRDEAENEKVVAIPSKDKVLLKAKDFTGPVGAIIGEETRNNIKQAASIVAHYINKAVDAQKICIEYWQDDAGKAESIVVPKAPRDLLDKLRVTK